MASGDDVIQVGLLGEAVEHGPALVFVADAAMRYVAVNQFACDVLGYEREELLALEVTDVAREPVSPLEYADMIANGHRFGTAILTRKDGGQIRMTYRASSTTAAGMELFVAVGFVVYDAFG
jgi:PAS domain S-box-containing protein